jgi:hypothetical protein
MLWNRKWTVATRLLPQTGLRLTSRGRLGSSLRCSAALRGPKIKIRHYVAASLRHLVESSAVSRVIVCVFPAFIEWELDAAHLAYW